MPTTATKKTTKITVAEYRRLLDGEKKEIKIELSNSALSGAWDTIEKRIKKLVSESEIVGSWKIVKTEVRGGYDYYSRSYKSGTKHAIVGHREYTDAEVEVLGNKLLADKLKREQRNARARAANIKKYNVLAEKLGVDPLTA